MFSIASRSLFLPRPQAVHMRMPMAESASELALARS